MQPIYFDIELYKVVTYTFKMPFQKLEEGHRQVSPPLSS